MSLSDQLNTAAVNLRDDIRAGRFRACGHDMECALRGLTVFLLSWSEDAHELEQHSSRRELEGRGPVVESARAFLRGLSEGRRA
jgi:hypothetical protein